ncbi:hypothetical protein PROFUN_02252 [Planoprotostelium fungivorum]|uniref:Hormone-sensitive lipase n=1 Tax=Planoprotostelium fungivorum TaxID=1890364 RepID=A0A2P6NYD9_9EUKA|nr:hypothetical protein PROFUN_02252 [Planoprotostelium fungivorum]
MDDPSIFKSGADGGNWVRAKEKSVPIADRTKDNTSKVMDGDTGEAPPKLKRRNSTTSPGKRNHIAHDGQVKQSPHRADLVRNSLSHESENRKKSNPLTKLPNRSPTRSRTSPSGHSTDDDGIDTEEEEREEIVHEQPLIDPELRKEERHRLFRAGSNAGMNTRPRRDSKTSSDVDSPVLSNSAYHSVLKPTKTKVKSNNTSLSVRTLMLPHTMARSTTKAEFLSGPKLCSTHNPIVQVGQVHISPEDAERFRVAPLKAEIDEDLIQLEQLGENLSSKTEMKETKELCRQIKEWSDSIKTILDHITTEKTGIREGINGFRSLLHVHREVTRYFMNQLRKSPLLRETPGVWARWIYNDTEKAWLDRSIEIFRQPGVVHNLLTMAIRFSTKTVDLLVNHDQLADREMDVFSAQSDTVPRSCFYGRDFCPQYKDTIRGMLRVIMIANASYFFFKGWKRPIRLPLSFFSGVYFGFIKTSSMEWVGHLSDLFLSNIFSPQYLNTYSTFEAKKLSGFWNLTEGTWNEVVTAVSIPVSLDITLQLPPRHFKIQRKDGLELTILPPYLPEAKKPEEPGQPFLSVSIRYISYFDHQLDSALSDITVRTNLERTFAAAHSKIFRRREKLHAEDSAGDFDRILEGQTDEKLNKLSDNLIVHFHGGGFVSQTAASHGLYLRQWARDTGVPIVSVNYRLAPDYPFPVALQECFYSYVWALENCHKLGSSAKKVIVVGDSAGGNFAAAVTIRAITERIRIPDSLIMCYPALYMLYVPSPSRILSIVDSLLPQEALQNCFDAYLPKESGLDPLQNPFLSPACASDAILKRFPSDIRIMVGALDPLYDDSIWMAKRLTAVGKSVQFKVYETLNHGFLNFGGAPKYGVEMWDAVKLVAQWMNQVFRGEEKDDIEQELYNGEEEEEKKEEKEDKREEQEKKKEEKREEKEKKEGERGRSEGI